MRTTESWPTHDRSRTIKLQGTWHPRSLTETAAHQRRRACLALGPPARNLCPAHGGPAPGRTTSTPAATHMTHPLRRKLTHAPDCIMICTATCRCGGFSALEWYSRNPRRCWLVSSHCQQKTCTAQGGLHPPMPAWTTMALGCSPVACTACLSHSFCISRAHRATTDTAAVCNTLVLPDALMAGENA